MTSEQINEGLRLEEKSTQQPWKINTEYKVHDSVQIESSIPHEPIIYRGYEGDGGVCCMEDAEFIVWMRAHARELLECARRAESDISKAKMEERMRSQPTLDSFIDYCKANPEQRFWQALRNWAGVRFIFATDDENAYEKLSESNPANLTDTFYWEEKNV